VVVFFFGVPSALSFGILSGIEYAGNGVLEAVDFVASNLLRPISALRVALVVGWSWPPAQARTNADLTGSPSGGIWFSLLRYFAPPAILLILLQGLSLI
jgi:NSS family neurotransmitter:Na+ symporter